MPVSNADMCLPIPASDQHAEMAALSRRTRSQLLAERPLFAQTGRLDSMFTAQDLRERVNVRK
jgi:hypothetical protein